MSLVPLLVLITSMLWLKENPARRQFVGILVGLAGFVLFFSAGLKNGEPIGIGIVAVGLAGNAAFGVIGRDIARERQVDTLSLTAIPLAFGATMLLPLAFLIEGLPAFSMKAYGIILLLAVVNTACVYTLYNHALEVLAAFEMSMLVNLTPLITALWAWLLLGEHLSIIQLGGMISVITGTVLVQRGKQNASR